jgi:hypothetical protein
MNIREAGWRAIYQKYAVLPLNRELSEAIREFPGAENADHVVVYGFVDHQEGLCLELLAAARMVEDGLETYPPDNSRHVYMQAGYADEQEVFVFDENGEEGEEHPEYAGKLNSVGFHRASEAVEFSRSMGVLDPFRDGCYVDDVRVYMVKEHMEPEVCWLRIEDLDRDSHCIIGKVLRDPVGDFGCEAGDLVSFRVQKLDERTLVCCADFDLEETIVRKRTEEADPLRLALAEFQQEKTYETVNRVIEELRQRDVWLACNTVLSKDGQARLEALLDEFGQDMEKLNEYIMSGDDRIELVPDILKHEDGSLFLPVFAAPEDMGTYGDRYSKVEKPFLEVLDIVDQHEEDLVGIVVDPFTESMIIAKDLFDAVRNGLDAALSAEMRNMPPSRKQS